ncbi:MAG: hypothetical protein PHI27_08790 [Eubacteriales bacterium]|nr:hypothetical protein [Eubacteriales bacterium]MDD3882336.1 hypothetical protein [Eubacteriales bacterium]MDD4512082.1 hypothetical protein [Eubacteriales bacterium]
MKIMTKAAAFICAAKAKRANVSGRDSVSISRGQSIVVHGITVKKAAIGRYLDIQKRLPGIVMEVIDAAFPGEKPAEALESLMKAGRDDGALRELITRLIAVVPEKAVQLLCELIGANYKFVCENLSPNELLDVLKAFWKLNDYTDFFEGVRKAGQALRTKETSSMFSTGSPAPSQSASQSES